MLNFIYKSLGSLLFSRPDVQYIQAKNLNLYFKNSKNPQYHLLNLTKISLLSFDIEVIASGGENVYNLIAKFIENSNEEIITVASFESKKEAETALQVVRTKLFSPSKKLVKVTTLIAFLIVIWSLIVDVSIDNLKRTQLLSYKKQEISTGQAPAPTLANNQQNLEAILQQAIAAQAAQSGGGGQQPNTPQPQQVETPPSASDFLIKSLN